MNNIEKDVEMLEAEVVKLRTMNKELLEKCLNIEKNLMRQIETYNQHIAGLHVHPIGP
jgi:hypothetical protein